MPAKKRRSAIDDTQFGFSFEAPRPARMPAQLAGLDKVMAAVVGMALKEDRRSREEIAGAVSSLLCEDVSRWMLDAYASEARDSHNISAARFFAVIAVTNRFDLLDATLRRIGAAVLVGEEVITARVGHLQCEVDRLLAEMASIKGQARPIGSGSGGKS
jgi:hypothetical protein